MKRSARTDDVDAALEAARSESAASALPPALRSRILAATRPVETAPPRGRLLDFALRAAAVAAAFAAVLFVMPVSLEAAEFDAGPLVAWNARLADTVARHLPSLDASDLPSNLVSDVPAWPLAAGAAVLVLAGVALARSGRRR